MQLRKAKKYDWKDSNMALFGSDTEKKVKKESAETEPAWKGAGQAVGMQIWRIVKFKVTHWPKEDYGKFYDGDSYIILNTYKKPESEVSAAERVVVVVMVVIPAIVLLCVRFCTLLLLGTAL